MFLRLPFLFLTLSFVAGCQTTDIRSFENASQVNKISKEEERLWHQAGKANKSLLKSDAIYQNPEVTQYVQGVMDKLFPEFKGKITVRLLNTPYLNAFALPSGDIYLNVGMLSRFENEAQLATVLAHEGAHFIHKHSLKQTRNTKGSAAFAVSLAVVGIPIIGDLVALSSIFGYSQELETEADNVAYKRLIIAGYDGRQAKIIFQQLAAEVKSLGVDEPFFFATHPRLKERIENYAKLDKSVEAKGDIGEEQFLASTKQARLYSLDSDLSLHRYKSIILNIGKNITKLKSLPEANYYLGEAYRLRNEENDNEKTIIHYNRAMTLAPEFAPTYRAIGLYYMKNEQYRDAHSMLGEYLKRSPKAKDKAFIAQYYNKLEEQLENE